MGDELDTSSNPKELRRALHAEELRAQRLEMRLEQAVEERHQAFEHVKTVAEYTTARAARDEDLVRAQASVERQVHRLEEAQAELSAAVRESLDVASFAPSAPHPSAGTTAAPESTRATGWSAVAIALLRPEVLRAAALFVGAMAILAFVLGASSDDVLRLLSQWREP